VLTSRDEAKFFAQANLEAANAAAKTIYAKNQRDLLIETFATVPDGKTDAVKAMKAEEKQRFFRDWTEKRERDLDIHGIYLLVCREPSYLLVHVSKDPALNLHNEDAKKLNDAIFPQFKDKKFDAGLDAFVKLATELLSR
jgi:hypothetical protein